MKEVMFRGKKMVDKRSAPQRFWDWVVSSWYSILPAKTYNFTKMSQVTNDLLPQRSRRKAGFGTVRMIVQCKEILKPDEAQSILDDARNHQCIHLNTNPDDLNKVHQRHKNKHKV